MSNSTQLYNQYSTTQGMAVQIAGLRSCIDPLWNRGFKLSQNWVTLAQGRYSQGTAITHPNSFAIARPATLFCLSQSFVA